MWCVACLCQYTDACERDGDSDLALVQLITSAEHLLPVPSQLLAGRDEALFGLSLIQKKLFELAKVFKILTIANVLTTFNGGIF